MHTIQWHFQHTGYVIVNGNVTIDFDFMFILVSYLFFVYILFMFVLFVQVMFFCFSFLSFSTVFTSVIWFFWAFDVEIYLPQRYFDFFYLHFFLSNFIRFYKFMLAFLFSVSLLNLLQFILIHVRIIRDYTSFSF